MDQFATGEPQTVLTATDKQWGVLVASQMRHNHQPVKASLENIGVEYFIPLIDKVSITAGRHVHRLSPLFGRYVFFVINEFWKSVSTLRGVSGLMLTAESNPAIIDPAQMAHLKSSCVSGIYQQTSSPSNKFVYGQRVTPISGPLENRVGTYDGSRSRHREAAVFNLFGREQNVIFKAGDLIAA